MRRFTKMFMIGLALLLFQAAIHAQATTGTVRGTVVDANGSVVANANVTIKNEATGAESSAVSGSEGGFEFANLLPGKYTVTTGAPNYKRQVKTGVVVNIGTVNSIDVALEVGSVNETVTVTSSGEGALQTEQAQVSGTIETRRVEELPSNAAGGGIDTLALLIPGVVGNRAGGTNTNGTGLSVNGNRGRSNNFQIDGEDNNDLTVGGPALFVDFADSVQEFQVITSNFSAQYGRNQGAVVNIVTKGGTNDFHGSAFIFHRDRRNLDSLTNTQRRACDPTITPTPAVCFPPRSLENIFGGTVGGPVYLPYFGEGTPAVWKGTDKLFFFFGYQGIRNPSTTPVRSTQLAILQSEMGRLQSTYPTSAVMNTLANYGPFALGADINFVSTTTPVVSSQINLANPAGCPRVVAVGTTPPAGCGTYTTYTNPVTGQPFLTGGPYDVINFGSIAAPSLFQAAQFEKVYDTAFTENYHILRFDVRPTSRDSGSFRWIKQASASTNANSGANGFTGDLPAGSRNIGGDWNHQFSNSIVNNLRISTQRISVEFGGGCEPRTPGCIPGPSNLDVAFANIAFPALGITKTGALATIGSATNLPQGRIGTVTQYADTVNWITGKHSLIFGGEYKKIENLVPFLPNFNGAYSYSNANRMINNAPSGLSIAVGDPLLPFVEKDWYFFFQDDFKVLPNLTLNLGVRYEYTGQPINILNEVSIARESSSTPLFSPSIPLAERVHPSVPVDTNNWAPRFGFAWTPTFWKGLFGEDATVFRGGYSWAYEPAFYNILLNNATGAPFAASLAVAAGSLASEAPGQIYALPLNAYGDAVRANAAATGLLPLGQLDPRYLAQTRVASDFHAPYSEQWSFGMQRQFGRNFMAEVRYVGTKGHDLFQNINGNFFMRPLVQGFSLTKNTNGTGGNTLGIANTACPVPGATTCINFPGFSNLLPAGTTFQTCVNNPATVYIDESACNGRQFQFAGITERANSGNSIYHSMQSRFSGRFLSNSLSLAASYTWSKSIDNASEIFAFGGGDIGSPNAQNPFCIDSCERGVSSFDRRHVFSTNFIYDLPFYKDQQGWVGKILGGWQLNGIYLLTSGAPYTPSNGSLFANIGNALGFAYLSAGDRPFSANPNADQRLVGISQIDAFYAFGRPISDINGFWSMNAMNATVPSLVAVTPNDVRFIVNGPGAAKLFGTPFGSAGRSILTGPIFNHMNFGIFKNIKVTEGVRVQIRGEMFNALNHPNPGFGFGSGAALPTLATTSAGISGGAFGENTDIALARRVVQFALRITF